MEPVINPVLNITSITSIMSITSIVIITIINATTRPIATPVEVMPMDVELTFARLTVIVNANAALINAFATTANAVYT